MPDWKSAVRQRLAFLRLTAAAESALIDEIAHHLEDRFRELRSGGAAPDDACRQTMSELDDLDPLTAGLETNQRMPKIDEVRAGEESAGNIVESLWKDFRYAARPRGATRVDPLEALREA